jgi:glyoxylase-like metal-dependent hydrolase (beta-lactamase superfamily II)
MPRAVVVEVPGHTDGSIAIYLPTERVLFTGDNIASIGRRPILGPFNVSRSDAIVSFGKLAKLDVETACFGHGDPIVRGAGDAMRKRAAQL